MSNYAYYELFEYYKFKWVIMSSINNSENLMSND